MHQELALISQVHHLSDRLLSHMISLHGHTPITGGQIRILNVLWQEDDLSFLEVARRSSLAKNTVSTMISRLVDEGLVEIVPCEHDRRSKTIRLAAAGKRLKSGHGVFLESFEALAFKGVDAEDKEVFGHVLVAIKNNLKAAEEEKKA